MSTQKKGAGISVIMPTYNQSSFIACAINSLKLQSFKNWELIIINDGSTDSSNQVIQSFLPDDKIIYLINEENMGLGASLNMGIANASHDLIAYLPSDDIYYSDHLNSLFEKMMEDDDYILIYSGMKCFSQITQTLNYKVLSYDLETTSLQLVQVLHKKTEDKWRTRDEIVTDNLDYMFWDRLLDNGKNASTQNITCEWVFHMKQRHMIINEAQGGGINYYKQFYNVKQPIIFESTGGNHIDETEIHKRFPPLQSTDKGLKILLVGELSYNADRIYALEEKGHKLYGLWMNKPMHWNGTGPLPFGNVEDIPYENWVKLVHEIKPDIIYAMLNHPAVEFAHKILKENPGIPFVWHFKEGPFNCRQNGTWEKLIDLFQESDGQIYCNNETHEWFSSFLNKKPDSVHILDGDLPKKDWFIGDRSPLLSDQDGEIHTVVPGRPFGLIPENILELANEKIHIHFYGDVYQQMYKHWIDVADELAPGYLHIHPMCSQQNWLKEFSQYDAGWLHFFKSENEGELMRADWNDLNYPARMTTLAAAGLPMLQRNNTGHIVATQSITSRLGVGIFFDDFSELGGILRNKTLSNQTRKNVWENRLHFSFDHHIDGLITFFKKIIANKNSLIN